jgi:stress response protein YsnF
MKSSRRSQALIPVVEEHAKLARRREETGAVRVRIRAEQVQEHCDVEAVTENVEVLRVAVNAVVEERRAPWTDGDALVVPVYEEVLVRHLVLKEEIRLVRHRSVSRQQRAVPLRREHAIVERRDQDGAWQPVDVVDAVPADKGRKRRETTDPSTDRSK